MKALEALARLNDLPADAAEVELRRVCGAAGWARRVAAGRPYADGAALAAAAEAAWDAMAGEEWLEAWAAHPRIGEERTVSGRPAGDWSRAEQAGAATDDGVTRARLAGLQREYERRFGWPFVVCATGKSAAEILADCRARLAHAPAKEREVAAGEERKIGRLRLAKSLAEGGEG